MGDIERSGEYGSAYLFEGQLIASLGKGATFNRTGLAWTIVFLRISRFLPSLLVFFLLGHSPDAFGKLFLYDPFDGSVLLSP